jgi:uncharacterized protein
MSRTHSTAPANPEHPVHPLRVLNVPPRSAEFRFEAPQIRKIPLWTLAGLVFLLLAVSLLVAMHGTPPGVALGFSFVSIILEALPFVMLGSLLGGLVEVFVPREFIVRLLPRRKFLAILVAASLGLLLPVCECAVIPFTRRLVRKGVPFSTAVAYLLAGPIVNVLVGSATLMAYAWNWHILAARMIFGYVVAVTVALVIDRWFPGQSALLETKTESAADCGCGHDHDHQHEHNHDHDHAKSPESIWKRLADAVNHAADDFLQVGQFLVIGAFVAAICQTIIPRHAFLALSHTPAVAILIMMGLAVALNLCSGADAFVASSFRSVLPLSAQMGFMVLGPMLDLKLSAMYLSFIRKRAFIALVVLMYSFVFALMIGWEYFVLKGAR